MKWALLIEVAALWMWSVAAFASEPVRIIFDTDMDSDCDDAGAVAVLHALADKGEAKILGTVVSSLYKWNVPCMEVLNRHYCRPNLPIGAPKRDAVDSHAGSKYARQIAEMADTELKYKSNSEAPDATMVYRQLLAAQPDESVVILTVGEVTNIRNLLRSEPDQSSPLTGPELIKKKVRRWVCMGGRYPQHLDAKVFGNFKTDPKAIGDAARDWPVEVVFTGLGDDILTGRRLKETPTNNPVRRAYQLYLGNAPARPSWDLIATLYAVRPDAKWWRLNDEGYNHIFPNGTNEWRDEPDSRTHRLLLLNEGGDEAVRITLEELMIENPRVENRAPDSPSRSSG